MTETTEGTERKEKEFLRVKGAQCHSSVCSVPSAVQFLLRALRAFA